MSTPSSRLVYNSRRLAQTPRTFANWPAVLRQLAGQALHREEPALTFDVRSGPLLTTPNVPGARLPIYEQFADDCYHIDWVLGPAGEPCTVIDIGSHVGAFATNIASRRADVRVECYEPSPASAGFLRSNIERNGLADRMRVHQQAVAGEVGTAVLDDNDEGSVHNGLVRDGERLVHGDDAPGRRHGITVETTTFDAAVAAAPGPVTVVKMDCEGGEYELVRASSPQSWATVRRVVMEYHPVPGETWAALRDWLAGVGLAVVRDEPGRPGLGTAWLQRQ
ncbi:MAG: FkbM family methyltransferase [Marmoricola sp.]